MHLNCLDLDEVHFVEFIMMKWPESIKLKIALLNAENLFLLFDTPPSAESLKMDETEWKNLSSSIFPNKPLGKAKELARSFQDMNPDIIMLCEVGGLESLKNFNELFLNAQYRVALIEGNSDRHIDVGFLIRKDLPFYFDLFSNKNRLLNFVYPHERNSKNSTSEKFSRDAVELRCFTKNSDQPFLILLLTHLKSRLDPEKIDPDGFLRREAELKCLIEIQQEIQDKHPEIPLVVAGDFNGNASRQETDREFQIIYQKTNLEDILQLPTPQPDRSTYYQVKVNGKTEGKQIDYCFLNPAAQKKLVPQSTGVFRYKDEFGFPIDSPQTLESKQRLPSDHYPLVFELQDLDLRS